MQIKKNRKALPLTETETKKSTDAKFAWAVGAAKLEQHDPTYHVTESFQQSFDRIGRSHGSKRTANRPRAGRRQKRSAGSRATGNGRRPLR